MLRILRKPALVLFVILSLLVAFFVYCSLTDGSSPQWRNQKQSALVISQGEYISLQADALDTGSLRKAVLSTNETGIWKNETQYAALWRQEAVYGFDNFGTATYENGVLYAPSKGNNNVYAINALNGNIIWNKTVRQCDASPCITDDAVYVAECSGPSGEPTPFPKAMALNKTTGEEIWHFTEPSDHTWVGSPLVYGDYVYYTTYDEQTRNDGTVYALNRTNGTPIWHQDVGAIVCSVALDKGMVFVSVYSPQGQYALNATTGEVIWHKVYGASWDSSPVIYDDMLIQVAYNTTTRVWTTWVLNETNGEVIRTFNKGGTGTPLVHDGKIFIANRAWMDWRMYAYDLTTGTESWHTELLHNGVFQNQSYCSSASAGGAIYYQALNGTFYVINETDGSVLWRFTMGSLGFGSPSIGDGCVFITNDFALYAFKIGTGSGDWRMFCQSQFHQSYSEHAVEYVRCPLTEPKDFKDSSNVWVAVKFVWCNKSIVSGVVGWRIYFFDDADNVNVTDIMVFYIGMAVHNVAVVDVSPEGTAVEQNQTLPIHVTVLDNGNFSESFNLTVYYDSTLIDSENVTLNSGESRVLDFVWNTTEVPLSGYLIGANASVVPEEVYVADNVYVSSLWDTVFPEFSLPVVLLALFSVSTLFVAFLKRKKWFFAT